MSSQLKRGKPVLKVFYELETFLRAIPLQPRKASRPAGISACEIWQGSFPRVMSSGRVFIAVQVQIQISVAATGNHTEFPGTPG